MSDNYLTDDEVFRAIPGLRKVKRIDLSANKLLSGAMISKVIQSLRGLKVLKATHNILQGSFCVDCSKHLRLKEIHLSKNKLSQLKFAYSEATPDGAKRKSSTC